MCLIRITFSDWCCCCGADVAAAAASGLVIASFCASFRVTFCAAALG